MRIFEPSALCALRRGLLCLFFNAVHWIANISASLTDAKIARGVAKCRYSRVLKLKFKLQDMAGKRPAISRLTNPKAREKSEKLSPQDVLLEQVSVIEERICAYPTKRTAMSLSLSVKLASSSSLWIFVLATRARTTKKRKRQTRQRKRAPMPGKGGPSSHSSHMPLLFITKYFSSSRDEYALQAAQTGPVCPLAHCASGWSAVKFGRFALACMVAFVRLHMEVLWVAFPTTGQQRCSANTRDLLRLLPMVQSSNFSDVAFGRQYPSVAENDANAVLSAVQSAPTGHGGQISRGLLFASFAVLFTSMLYAGSGTR